jgi:hypothetical protein
VATPSCTFYFSQQAVDISIVVANHHGSTPITTHRLRQASTEVSLYQTRPDYGELIFVMCGGGTILNNASYKWRWRTKANTLNRNANACKITKHTLPHRTNERSEVTRDKNSRSSAICIFKTVSGRGRL